MWDSKLSRVCVTKQCTEFKLDETQHTNWAPHRAGVTTAEFEEIEMERMLKIRYFKLAEPRWVAPIVFTWEDDGPPLLCRLEKFKCP